MVKRSQKGEPSGQLNAENPVKRETSNLAVDNQQIGEVRELAAIMVKASNEEKLSAEEMAILYGHSSPQLFFNRLDSCTLQEMEQIHALIAKAQQEQLGRTEELDKLEKIIPEKRGRLIALKTSIEAQWIYGHNAEMLSHFVALVEEKGLSGVTKLVSAQCYYGDDMQRFKIFLQMIRRRNDFSGLSSITDAVKRPLLDDLLKLASIRGFTFMDAIHVSSLAQACAYDENEMKEVVKFTCSYGYSYIRVLTIVAENFGEDKEEFLAQKKTIKKIATARPEAMEILEQCRSFYDGSRTRFNYVIDIIKRAKSPGQAKEAVKAIMAARNVYGADEKKLASLVEVAIKRGPEHVVYLRDYLKEHGENRRKCDTAIEITISQGFATVEYLEKIIRKFPDDEKEFIEVARMQGAGALISLWQAQHIWDMGNDDVFNYCFELAKNSGADGIKIFQRAFDFFEGDINKDEKARKIVAGLSSRGKAVVKAVSQGIDHADNVQTFEAFINTANTDTFKSLVESNIDIQALFKKLKKMSREAMLSYVEQLSFLLAIFLKSNSLEFRRVRIELIDHFLSKPKMDIEEMKAMIESIKDYFENSNVPLCLKIAYVFNTLHSNRSISDLIFLRKKRLTGTVQTMVEGQRKGDYSALRNLFRNDLIYSALRSNDSNLREFLKRLAFYKPVIDAFEHLVVDGQDAPLREYIDKNPDLGMALNFFGGVASMQCQWQARGGAEQYINFLNKIKKSLAPDGGSLATTYVQNFLGPFAIKTAEDGLIYMDRIVDETNRRNKDFAVSGTLQLENGDYIKGLCPPAIDYLFREGNRGREFLGKDTQHSDATPFDVDWLRLTEIAADEEFRRILHSTTYNSKYSDKRKGIGLLIKNRGQFYQVNAKSDDITTAAQALKDIDGKFETVFSNIVRDFDKGEHWGVRTAVPVSEFSAVIIDPAILSKDRLNALKQNIVLSGFYIPVVDNDGHIIFDYQEWENIAKKYKCLKTRMDENNGDGHQKFNEPAMGIVDGPKGSTPCLWFVDTQGQKYLFKFYGDLHKAVNESFFCMLYNQLGIHAPETFLGRHEGKWAFVSKEIKNASSANSVASSFVDGEKIKGFVADCLFANWDAPHNDNILFTEINGVITIYRIDNGGSGMFRAAEEAGKSIKKENEEFDKEIKELVTFLSEAHHGGYRHLKNKLSVEEIVKQGDEILASLTQEKIDELYAMSGMEAVEINDIRKTNDILKKRLVYLGQYLNTLRRQNACRFLFSSSQKQTENK